MHSGLYRRNEVTRNRGNLINPKLSSYQLFYWKKKHFKHSLGYQQNRVTTVLRLVEKCNFIAQQRNTADTELKFNVLPVLRKGFASDGVAKSGRCAGEAAIPLRGVAFPPGGSTRRTLSPAPTGGGIVLQIPRDCSQRSTTASVPSDVSTSV